MIPTHTVMGSQPKVSQQNVRTVIGAENILRLEVAMKDAFLMTRVNSVNDASKDCLDEIIVISVKMKGDGTEQVAAGAKIQNNIDKITLIDDFMHHEYIRVITGKHVEIEFASLKFGRSGIVRLTETFDSIVDRIADGGVEVEGFVNNTIGTRTKQILK
jgi:hypothetical protein